MTSPFIPSPFIYGDIPAGGQLSTIIIASSAPTTSQNQYQPGTFWLVPEPTGSGNLYCLLGFISGVPQWQLISTGSGSGSFTTLTVTGQSTLGATNITGTTNIVGTTNINTSGSASTLIGNLTGGTTIVGDLSVSRNIIMPSAATYISMNGGNPTDFIGTATLVAGQQTINNTNIAATDRIMITRNSLNASPALGNLIYTINPGVSFVVQSYDDTGALANTDVSGFSYIIFRQT